MAPTMVINICQDATARRRVLLFNTTAYLYLQTSSLTSPLDLSLYLPRSSETLAAVRLAVTPCHLQGE
jgi:hypothetical protein